jgi:hypothetical protein
MDWLAKDRQDDENGEVAGEVQRERCRHRRIDDELVRKRHFADESRIGSETHGAALQRLLRREPGPQRNRDKREEALPAEPAGTEDHREHEPIDAEKRERMQQRPCEARHAAQVPRSELAPEEVAKERAIAHARHRRRWLRRREGCGRGD